MVIAAKFLGYVFASSIAPGEAEFAAGDVEHGPEGCAGDSREQGSFFGVVEIENVSETGAAQFAAK